MDADTLTILGTVLAVGFGLATLLMRTTARIDRRIDRAEDRFESAMNTFRTEMDTFRTEMNTFRTEMRRLAERQSHVEGRFDERGSPAD